MGTFIAALQHRCIHLDTTEHLKVGGLIDSGEGTQKYMVIDIMPDRVKAIKHDGVTH